MGFYDPKFPVRNAAPGFTDCVYEFRYGMVWYGMVWYAMRCQPSAPTHPCHAPPPHRHATVALRPPHRTPWPSHNASAHLVTCVCRVGDYAAMSTISGGSVLYGWFVGKQQPASIPPNPTAATTAGPTTAAAPPPLTLPQPVRV